MRLLLAARGRPMIERLKHRYNRWLFKKYGFEQGVLFEKIPIVYKLIPLWSPSIYGHCEGEQLTEWFLQGIKNCEIEKEDLS